MKNKKIVIMGASGVGKTTLAQWLSEKYDIPFITTSTKPLWEKYGAKTHNDIIKLAMHDPIKGLEFQNELLDYRETELSKYPQYVSDRSPIDNIVYFLLQNSSFLTPEQTIEYIGRAREILLSQTTHIIYLKLTPDVPLENDGMRVTNIHYQIMVDVIMENTIKVYIKEPLKEARRRMIAIHGWDFNKRCESVSQYLSNIIFTNNLNDLQV